MSDSPEPQTRPTRRRRALWILPPVLLGAAILAWQIPGAAPPEHGPPDETARSVRVIEVAPTSFVPRTIGYGFVEPGTVWQGIAQVEGQIVSRHPQLERGRILGEGTELMRIDPTDYELAVARAEANLASAEAQLAEIAVEDENLKASIDIQRRALALEQKELKRQKDLVARGTASRAAADQAEAAVLTQRQQLQELENQLGLLPTQRGVLEANVKLRRADLEDARLDLERTVLRLPFTARVADVAVEASQFVRSGDKLIEADSIDQAEISVQVPLERMRPLIPRDLVPGNQTIGGLTDRELTDIARRLGLTAKVRLLIGVSEVSWEGRFDRISDTVDPTTRTLGVIVVVEEPYRSAIPGERPPLTKNMFVQVELAAPASAAKLVVPSLAVHRAETGATTVYLAGPDDRLVRREVSPGVRQGDLTVIDSGLAPGDRVVVSDLVPAVEGMLLAPSLDAALATRLAGIASAAEPLE